MLSATRPVTSNGYHSTKPKTRKQELSASPALHKNVIFLGLICVTTFFVTTSILIYVKLDTDNNDAEENGDDLILGSGAGDGLRRDVSDRNRRRLGGNKHDKLHHHHHHHHGGGGRHEKMVDQSELYLDDEPQNAIHKFQKDQQEDAQERRRQGIVTVRENFEQERFDPDDWERIHKYVDKLRIPLQEQPIPTKDLSYDIYNCPMDPPPNYPYAWNVMDVLENWNPDDTTIPTAASSNKKIHHGLCIFDWNNQRDDDRRKAENYRNHEVPFLLLNHPEVLRATERWTTPGYLQDLIGDETNVNEHSKGNHFMYWKTRSPGGRPDYEPPTDTIQLRFKEWSQKARVVENVTDAQQQTTMEHWYYRLNGMLHNHAYLYEELPFFDPTKGRSLTVVEPEEHRGINCRFGMRGTVAEAHYDSHNNFIAIMGGQRRYILGHPDQCENMELYPVGHPSARHSRIDWSKAYFLWRDSDRPFVNTKVNEILLQPGDLLYLPTYWFHFIVSLSTTYQCNSRSGESKVYQEHIDKCGFGKKHKKK